MGDLWRRVSGHGDEQGVAASHHDTLGGDHDTTGRHRHLVADASAGRHRLGDGDGEPAVGDQRLRGAARRDVMADDHLAGGDPLTGDRPGIDLGDGIGRHHRCGQLAGLDEAIELLAGIDG